LRQLPLQEPQPAPFLANTACRRRHGACVLSSWISCPSLCKPAPPTTGGAAAGDQRRAAPDGDDEALEPAAAVAAAPRRDGALHYT
jgi:hypothetical protein